MEIFVYFYWMACASSHSSMGTVTVLCVVGGVRLEPSFVNPLPEYYNSYRPAFSPFLLH